MKLVAGVNELAAEVSLFDLDVLDLHRVDLEDIGVENDKVGELAEDPASQTMYISNSACPEDAQFVADEVKRRYGVKEIIINSIGPVSGAHTGPGCVALFFMGKHR